MSADLEHLTPAEAFAPGEFLAEELEERGWTVAQFAEILGRPTQAISEILHGRKAITARTAAEIAAATGTAPETWLRLQDVYDVWRLGHDIGATARLAAVARRGRLAALVPVAELRKRGVIPAAGLDEQERAVRELLDMDSLDDSPRFIVAAHRSDHGDTAGPGQLAWLGCVRRAAAALHRPAFDRMAFDHLVETLTRVVPTAAELSRLPNRFAAAGVRLVYVPHFKGSKIDGGAYRDVHGPVIALSGRIARLDSVLFTLLHECAHVRLHLADGDYALDEDLTSPSSVAAEVEADALAASWALPEPLTLRAPFSRARVVAEAERLGVHAAVVVGRLHHEGRLPWSHLNNLVPKVRGELEQWWADAAT